MYAPLKWNHLPVKSTPGQISNGSLQKYIQNTFNDTCLCET